jgi:hypothetical protein
LGKAKRVAAHIFFHPDYTVGPGLSPGLLTLLTQALAGSTVAGHTAGGEFHPAPKTYLIVCLFGTGAEMVAAPRQAC